MGSIPLCLVAVVCASGSLLEHPDWGFHAKQGYVPVWECHEGRMGEKLVLDSNRTRPSEVFRNGQRLLFDQDFRFQSGDSSLVLASPLDSADTVCLIREFAPAIPPSPGGWIRLYDKAAIPVLPVSFPSEGEGEPGFSRLSGAPDKNPDSGAYKLDLSGSKSISVTLGHGGAMGLDAALFVNLNGQVSENVFLEGSLSDQNVPAQPEGNTATLREVDNKFLRVYGRGYEYWLGDYLLGYGSEGEDRLSAKAEGARFRFARGGFGGTAQYASSRGAFQVDTLRGVDGKQGGYYLRGKDGRSFITVLAGTERIWRNGSLLKRGSDYAIEYAEGRVDFLQAVWVTGENLFTAEFQYTEETYPRTLGGVELTDTLGSFRFGMRAIQEFEDGKNPSAGSPADSILRRYEIAGDAVTTDSSGRVIPMPERLGSGVLFAEWDGGEHGKGRLAWLGSLQDRNLYSDRNDEDNLGFSTRFQGAFNAGRPLDQNGLIRLTLEPTHEHRSADFASFHQAVESRGFRDRWNLYSRVGERDFDANSLRVSVEPFSGWQTGVGAGLAMGNSVDSESVESRRGEVFTRLRKEALELDLASEVKQAKDPQARDNYRQSSSVLIPVFGWRPKVGFLRDEWLQSTGVSGNVFHSELWQPDVSLESPTLWNRWNSTTESNLLYGSSNFSGTSADLQDSLFDLGVSQKFRLLGWGPVSGEVIGARRFHRAWRAQTDGSRPSQSEDANFDRVELDLAAADHRHGYGAQTHYRTNRTAEIPLVERYDTVAQGRGDYVFDSLLNAFHRVETGGNYVFTGLRRDTSLGQRPYQDLQWNLSLDFSPGAMFPGLHGVLADLELNFNLETDYQDSAKDAIPVPRLSDGDIESVRSGRARYAPTLRWRSPTGLRSANLDFQRDFSKGAGSFAYRELRHDTRGEYRWQWAMDWEAATGGRFESREREGLGAVSVTGRSRVETWRAHSEIFRKLPRGFTLNPGAEVLRVTGDDAGLPLDLNGVTPKFRVEKGGFFGGRASLEYGWHYFFGDGEGSYFATEGYRKGSTHRVEALAQSEIKTYLHLNMSYLARLDPGESSWDQKLTAELRAVF